MTRYAWLVVALLIPASLLYAQQSPAELASESRKLQKQLADQQNEIFILTQYTDILKRFQGDPADDPTGRAATQPAKKPSLDEKLQSRIQIQTPLTPFGVNSQIPFDGNRLENCLDFLRKFADINIVVDWPSLQAAGVDQDTPITCELHNVSASQVFDVMLDGLSSTKARLAYVVDNGAVRIATVEEFNKHPVTKAYDVTALLAPQANQAEAQAQLARVIKESVAFGSWTDEGGSVGSIGFTGAKMSVTQAPTVMPMVERLVTQLEGSVKPGQANQLAMLSILEQTRQIEALRAEVEQLTARCRAAGKKVPAKPYLVRPPIEVIGQAIPFGGAFEDNKFTTCIDFMRNAAGINIVVNWKALESAGIEKATGITLQLRDRTIGYLLAQLLQQAGAGHAALGYEVEDNWVAISTQEDLDRTMATRVYDIRDLLDHNANQQAAVNALVAAIMKENAPDSWRAKGGGAGGSVRDFNGLLIVTQSKRVHRMIDAYLEKMRHPVQPAKP